MAKCILTFLSLVLIFITNFRFIGIITLAVFTKFAGGVDHVNYGIKIGYMLNPPKIMQRGFSEKNGGYDWGFSEEKSLRHLFK